MENGGYDMGLGCFRDLMGVDSSAQGDGKSQSVLECARMQPLGRPVSGGFPAPQTGQSSSAIGGASQVSILPRPDERALVCEAGSDGGGYTLCVAGVAPLTPRSNYATSIHDR